MKEPSCSAEDRFLAVAARYGPLPSHDRKGVVLKLNLLLALGCCLAGCSHYSDFTLPPAAGGDTNLTFAFDSLPDPVLTRGDGWDSSDVLNPSVFRDKGGLVNYYSGFDGRTWRTGRAISS